MDWLLVIIIVLVVSSLTWFVVEHKRDLQKDKEIFDEYLEKQKQINFDKRGKLKSSLKRKPQF